MRAILHATLLVIFAPATSAQTSFVRYYQQAGGTHSRSMHELGSGNVLAGLAYSSGVSIIDPLGNILHTRRYLVDTFMMVQSVRKHTSNDFAFVGIYSKDTCDATVGTNPVIGRMDSLGAISHAKYYTFNGRCSAGMGGDLSITANNNILAWGRDRGFFAMRTSSTCDLTWARSFQHHRGGFRFIKELPNGDLLAGINVDTAGAAVGRMDADGNFIWLKSFFRPRGMITDALIEDDGSFIITGFTDSIASPGFLDPLPDIYRPKLFMMKLSGEGDVLWCKGYDIAPYRWYTRRGSRIDRALNGGHVLMATVGGVDYNYGYRPMLMKTDQNGDTLWTRTAGISDHPHTAYNMLVCSDGGYLLTGSDENLGSYLFKTDSMGYLPCHNHWQSTTIVDLFPTDSSFTLTSIDGATAHPAFVTEAVNPPITIVDGCATGIPQHQKHPSGFRVNPNPNAGHFTLSFPDPLMAESYYSVYDTMGKLLFQRPLPQGKETEVVDLSRFGAGTYVLRVTSKEGSCYERVVVE